MDQYREHINIKFNQSLQDSHQLQKWSITHKHEFWTDLWTYVGLIPDLPPRTTKAFADKKSIKDVPPFFGGVRINYAENVLSDRNPDAIALIGLREGQSLEGEKWTWTDLTEHVRKVRSALIRRGIRRGEVVAAIMSNSNWIIALFLACASMGALFTSISPDMGLSGCVSRLQQVEPTILFADSHQTYKGKQRSMHDKVEQIYASLSRKPQVYFLPLAPGPHPFPLVSDFLTACSATDPLVYDRLPFNAPLMILYSSGTSGPPKCIVHQHGIIIQLKKVALLHNSLTPKDIVFQFSSTSWVLWNVMNGHLSVGTTVICYDGSPLYPDPSTKLRVLEKHKCTYFGTSPRYLLELEMSGIKPSDFDLSHLRMTTTTGATLTADQFRWFYTAFPKRVHLSSVAGGTEIVTSWFASNPAGPLYAGEMQMIALGQDVDVGDPETGESIIHTDRPGELICRSPFPSMPLYFWNDPDNKKYHEAYFERYPRGPIVWAQHDWVQYNPATGGAQIHGRSDGTLNPSGIRFGSSEIYSVVESPRFNDRIADTLCVGRKRISDKDEVVFLFVRMRAGKLLTDALKQEMEAAIRDSLSPRHVPKYIIEIEEIPVTINGKKVEIAVKKIISGIDVKVSSTVANPECLDMYRAYRDWEGKREAKL